MLIRFRAAAAAFVIAATVVVACKAPPAPGPPKSEPVAWTASPVMVQRGARSTLRLSAALAAGWHVYAVSQPAGGPIATRITIDSTGPLAISGTIIASPSPVTQFDSSFAMNVSMQNGSFALEVPVEHVRDQPDTAVVSVRYQVCNASLCMPPHTTRLSVKVTGGAAVSGTAHRS